MTYPVMRLKYMANLNNEALGEETDPDYELQYIDIGNVDSSGHIHEVASYRFADAPSRARRRVRHGDVIVSCVRTYLQAIAPIETPPDNLIVSTGFAVVRPKEGRLRARFCKYALRDPHFLAEVERRSVGVSYPAINSSDLATIPIPAPSDDVQMRVGEFLDRETTRINALLITKQRLLDLLAEKRKAIIATAVTRGLDQNVKLRDSGVLWLGEIPAHWEFLKFSWCVFIAEGQVDPEDDEFSSWPLIAPNHIESGTGRLLGLESAAEQGAISGKYQCNPGDVIYSKIRPALRKATIAPQTCLCSADMYPLRVDENRLMSEYLLYYLLTDAFSVWAVLESNRVAMPKINRESLIELRIPVPPLSEQRAIVEFIATETAKLDVVCSSIKLTIALLKERRSALIAAAVTGQLSVGVEA